jgi:hypothetical protein
VWPKATGPSVLLYSNAFPIYNTVAREFVNGNANVIKTANTNIDSTTGLTIAGWINLTINTTYACLVQKDDVDVSGNRAWGLFGRYSAIGPAIFIFTGAGLSNVVSASPLNTGSWAHIAATYTFVTDGTSILNLYVNGVLDVNSITNAHGPISSVNVPITLGNRNGDTISPSGGIADIGIWNTVLSGSQIASLAAGNRASTVASAVLDWPITLASPEPESVNALNGVVTGTVGGVGPPLKITTGGGAFPQHLTGQTNTVQDFLYPGAVQPIVPPAFLVFQRQTILANLSGSAGITVTLHNP